jgi:hypothetical protein
VIRSDKFPKNSPAATERLFLDCNVVLCTLSMLSNPALLDTHIFNTVPVEVLIIDEASQINISDYMVRPDHVYAFTCVMMIFQASVRQVCPSPQSPQGLHVWRSKAA